MREILFRGKSLDTGEWVYGYLVNTHWYTGDCDMSIIIPIDSTLYPRCEISSYEPVDPETVGQWTGLVNKNGVKIFEGDVVDYLTWVITYAGDKVEDYHMNAGWYIQRDDFESWCELRQGDDYKVIGNKWDNPELCQEGVVR